MSLPEFHPSATPRSESRPNLRPVAPHEQPTRAAETAPGTQNQAPTSAPVSAANPVLVAVDQSAEQGGVAVERPVVALPTRVDATKAVEVYTRRLGDVVRATREDPAAQKDEISNIKQDFQTNVDPPVGI